MRVTFCDTCGAPIDARWSEIVLVCRYCGSQNAPGGPAEPVPPSTPDDGRPRLAVGGRTYVVDGLLAHGHSSDVYRGRWVMRLGELVVIKVLRALADRDLLQREWRTLESLRAANTGGVEHFAGRLPCPIAIGPVRHGREQRTVAVYGWPSGHLHTLEEVAREHPDGVEGQVAVWLLKRLLELLGFSHRGGWLHRAVLPPHVLVHPRDHGAMLVGWSAASKWSPAGDERLDAVVHDWRRFYPDGVLVDRTATPSTDVAMAARSVLAVAGAADFSQPRSMPGPLGRLIEEAAHGAHDDAWALLERLEEASLAAYGPPSYHPLPMPGWPAPAR